MYKLFQEAFLYLKTVRMGDKIPPLTLSTFCAQLLRENKIDKGTKEEMSSVKLCGSL